jgi:uncharacterized membrane protein
MTWYPRAPWLQTLYRTERKNIVYILRVCLIVLLILVSSLCVRIIIYSKCWWHRRYLVSATLIGDFLFVLACILLVLVYVQHFIVVCAVVVAKNSRPSLLRQGSDLDTAQQKLYLSRIWISRAFFLLPCNSFYFKRGSSFLSLYSKSSLSNDSYHKVFPRASAERAACVSIGWKRGRFR